MSAKPEQTEATTLLQIYTEIPIAEVGNGSYRGLGKSVFWGS
jgi:hypothetical protein